MEITLLKDEYLIVKFEDEEHIELNINYEHDKVSVQTLEGENRSFKVFCITDNKEDLTCMVEVYANPIATHCVLQEGHGGKHKDKYGKTRKDYKK